MKLSRLLLSALMATSFLPVMVATAHAEADPKLWPVMKEAFFAKRDMQEVDFIKIDAPRRAESGAQVPVTYSIDNVAANGVVIKKLYAFVDANPIPVTAIYHLSESLGNFQLATRIRFETDAFVRLVGETADGKLYLASREIRAAGGCGGMVENDEAAVRNVAGKIKLKVDEPVKFGSAISTTFNIKHIMRTGLQRDLVSQGYVPAFYINKTEFVYNGKPVMTVDVGVGTAEDPYFKFDFVPDAPGKLEVTATDNEGKVFTHAIDVKG
ncbi:MAG: quinoprotein dehydrogenase-associated SoxYZ-like carrier [Methylotenera sp.]|nr:quinoprotein dehydrogenase-associated SoxYZ-like carrier [Methylotenera sp.]MDO9233844.1 quinoprotein dehydrogenase-associated SoxYZ-like carrier [Methylotenera sp.]MDO9389434.1 quinoprotein dehydrogenase-associated SoxYZ-like carrier [Methylotenera sp.]MDP1595630.1 quinoprotein dehydrogenase-associated SoxYZ-like carrier [Methylotenera sp.]MDP1960195.1 quinoprotein dehydrogenase-associated SoxYZ-like carrier [Methylotenera sp.]